LVHRFDSFANPAVTVARSFSDTFAGIRPIDAPGFIIAQFVGLVLALPLLHRTGGRRPYRAEAMFRRSEMYAACGKGSCNQ
jgi:hypothetical protein